ncbi:hypothetical protein LguiB_024683 [Lonicera macranthoides]
MASGYSYLVAGTDGVGTKLKLAFESGIHKTIGIDLVAMSVNDIITSGAKPLFFLDCFATSHLDVDLAEKVIKGIVDGCQQSDCTLLGGETAEMPDFYADGEYDVSGFAVGIIKKDSVIEGKNIMDGDVLIGLPSSGVHSNGGGFTDNIPRVFPKGLGALIYEDSWVVPPVFKWIQEAGRIEDGEMRRTFNMGIGMVLVVIEDAALRILGDVHGSPSAYRIEIRGKRVWHRIDAAL